MLLLERYFVTLTLSYFEKLSALCANLNEYGISHEIELFFAQRHIFQLSKVAKCSEIIFFHYTRFSCKSAKINVFE